MVDINTQILEINKKGFLDIGVNPELDLFKEIEKLKN
jgi:hypothetical protein